MFTAAAVALALIATAAGLTASTLAVPGPTGPYAVGRLRQMWVDESRSEPHTVEESDRRAVALHIWYPADRQSGRPGAYVPDLPALASSLVASGELARWQVWGLALVRDGALDDARVSPEQPAYPVVLLSPGNVTNVAFYAALAEDLASHGYVVVGVDHPFQVAAVALPNGSIAAYDARADRVPPAERQASTARKIDERVADLAFVLERMRASAADRALLDGRLDLDRIAVMGHSNGGLAAVELCRRDTRLRACANLDGQQEGGPFSVAAGGTAPTQPFLFLTKETWLHPVIGARFEAAGAGAYRVVIPEATHQQFTDGPLFAPSPLPFDRPALRVTQTIRGFLRAFFARHLLQTPGPALGGIAAQADVYVNVYPLAGKPPLPVAPSA